MHRYLIGIFLLLSLLTGCNKEWNGKEKRVGIDPSWFPLSIAGREHSVAGFSTDLLKEIGKREKISITKVTVNWDDLVEGLQNHKYEAILSSMPPYVFNQKIFDFSELYLATGPVLIVPVGSAFDSLKKMKGKEVAVLPDTKGAILLEKYPDILIRTYDSIPKALNDVVSGALDGAIVDILSALAYCKDLYHDQLKIVTPPLTNEGLRMIALYGEESDLLKNFNRGLEKLKASGEYEKLLVKWNLDL
jgi:polar amino acid transport system substrate-binding protein